MTLKTSDLAICAEVSTSTVRDYSDLGLLGAVTRSNSSYRVFDPRMIPQFYVIRTLRELGFSLEEIRTFSEQRTPESSLDLFQRCSEQLSSKIAVLQKQLDILQSHAALIEEAQATQPGEIGLRTLPERRIRLSALGYNDSEGKHKRSERLRRAHGEFRQNGNAGCPLGYAYDSFFDLLEQPSQPAQFVSIDPQGPEIRPAGEYLVGTVKCGYDEKTSLPNRMFQFAMNHGIELAGPAYAVYLLDAASVTDPEQYFLQVMVKAVTSQEGS